MTLVSPKLLDVGRSSPARARSACGSRFGASGCHHLLEHPPDLRSGRRLELGCQHALQPGVDAKRLGAVARRVVNEHQPAISGFAKWFQLDRFLGGPQRQGHLASRAVDLGQTVQRPQQVLAQRLATPLYPRALFVGQERSPQDGAGDRSCPCLLYTSDAADE